MKKSMLLLMALLMFASDAVAQRNDRPGRQNRDEERNERTSNSEGVSDQTVDSGFVFVDGKYVAAPYRIRVADSQIVINERAFELTAFDWWANENRRNPGRATSERRAFRTLIECLESDCAIVLFAGHPVEVFDGIGKYDFLNALINDEVRGTFVSEEQQWLPAGANRHEWMAWISEFDCPPELSERATEWLEHTDQVTATNHAQINAQQALEASAYPLTVTGMLLVVLSIGHLLSCKPTSDTTENPEATSQHLRAVRRSVILVATLSALDLIWTILVLRTGSMKELNPLGAAIIENPQSLIFLKVAAISVAVGILLFLRRHRIAQYGAWWGCLICTLLMVRWLTFNSMFVG